MKAPLRQYFHFLILFLFISSFGCKPDFNEIVSESIAQLQKDKSAKAIESISNALIEYSIINKLEYKNVQIINNIIFHRNKKNLKIISPIEAKIEVPNAYNIIAFDPLTNYIAISNGINIRIFDSSGSFKTNYDIIKEGKNLINGIYLYQQQIYYLLNNKLNIMSLETEKSKQIFEKINFAPPYKGLPFKTTFFHGGKYLIITSGLTGSYYSNIIDLQNNSIWMTNLSVSSSKLFASNEKLYYISGASGAWTLQELIINSKNKKIIHSFSDLIDVHFFSSGIIFENTKGYWILDYTKKNEIKIPFKYDVIGTTKDLILIKTGGRYYLLDINKFKNIIEALQIKIPELFSTK